MDNNNNNKDINSNELTKPDSSQPSPAPPPQPSLEPMATTTTPEAPPLVAAVNLLPQSNENVTILDQVETPLPSTVAVSVRPRCSASGATSNPSHCNNSHSNRSRSRNCPINMPTSLPPPPPPPLPSTTSTSTSPVSASLRQSMSRDYFYFDANTFKQVKRLYEGMLMVAMAYSVTMIIMMIVLYKTLPQTLQAAAAESALSSSSSSMSTRTPPPTNQLKNSLLSYRNFDTMGASVDPEHALETFASEKNFHLRTRSRHESALTYLDQMIAINFLSMILYSLAFYAAHRELYTLTLAFTSTLAFTMMFSVVKIFVEGVHFPNNFMSLLLRVSIVFVALVYLGQLRRKQQYVQNANTFWLTPNSFLNHPVLRSSQMSPNQTAQLIREFLASTSNGGGSNSNKTDEDLIREYQDQPPNYEEALRCPVPATQRGSSGVAPLATASSSASIGLPQSKSPIHSVSSTNQLAVTTASGPPPPSFEQLSSSSSSPQFSMLAVDTLTPVGSSQDSNITITPSTSFVLCHSSGESSGQISNLASVGTSTGGHTKLTI